jgi:hypothetical protein
VGPIGGRIAFYTDRVEVYDVDDAAVNPRERERERAEPEPRTVMAPPLDAGPADRAEIDEVIQHTDAGDGTTQREHWEPNVETPGAEEGGVR